MGDILLGEKGSVLMENANVGEVKRKINGKESRFGKRYGFEVKLRFVKLRSKERLPYLLLCKEWEARQSGRRCKKDVLG